MSELPLAARPRLKFIDMARSLAIIMMLEGHFTGSALHDSYRKDEYWLYDFWHNLHGLTSPLFFAVTGVVFVYLLSKNVSGPYFQNERVRKGFGRVRMLLFWGFLIQFSAIGFSKDTAYGIEKADMLNTGFFNALGSWFHDILIPFYPATSNAQPWIFEYHFDWLQAFHVLQSIGIGILLLLTTFGIYKLINRGALHWYYFSVAMLVFICYGYMKHHIEWDKHLIDIGKLTKETRNFWPENAPKFIQNMFYGEFSDFSFVRYSGYVLLGGMTGAIIRKYESKVREWWFAALFIGIGLLFATSSQGILTYVDNFTNWIGITEHGHFAFNATGFSRMGQVITLLGLLMLVDANFNVKAQLFLKMGQNTFPVYIVHVIILYAGIIGIGLEPSEWYRHQFGPWESVGISVFFIIVFVFMVKYIEPLTELYYKVFGIFYPKHRKTQKNV